MMHCCVYRRVMWRITRQSQAMAYLTTLNVAHQATKPHVCTYGVWVRPTVWARLMVPKAARDYDESIGAVCGEANLFCTFSP